MNLTTEQQFGTDIASMTNYINGFLNDWAVKNQGVSFIGEEDVEKINIGFNTCIGPRVLLVFIAENPDGELAELTGRVKRDYDIIIQRGKLLTQPRNNTLTNTNGAARPFYQLVEECRDIARGVIFPTPMVYNPVIYNGIRPGASEGWLMDSYIISISVLCADGRIQTLPSELATGPFVGTIDPLEALANAPTI
jgi:hypothetical protein